MPTIELNCLIHGDTPDVANIFSVEVDVEKLNILFDDLNIKKKLGGKILIEMDKISKYFPHELDKKYIHIIIELPGYQLTFKNCVKRKELVPMDKIILKKIFSS
ncbi:2923_t:CDS:2 [Racocetra fulgida]|uniref:2923_t:CDS:1 n=1 Tax=Racocetra fulgida TaxID=60492 RepID=A0A9N9GDC5_9GLOM|nr:2923_t:CDS:2 [Racocetra fulgida]